MLYGDRTRFGARTPSGVPMPCGEQMLYGARTPFGERMLSGAPMPPPANNKPSRPIRSRDELAALIFPQAPLCYRIRGFGCDRDISPIVNASLQHPSPHGSESQSDYDPFNGTGQNEPDIESENERGRRAYASILEPPCTERSRIVAESRER